MNDKWTVPVSLQGHFVRLEPMQVAHIPLLEKAGKEKSIFKYMIYGDLSLPENMELWVNKLLSMQKEGTDMPFTVFLAHGDEAAGTTRYLNMNPEHLAVEIGGTWFSPEYQGTLVNIESKYLLLRYAFEELACIRVQFKADKINVRSIRAIEKLGATQEGVLRKHYILPDGRLRDSVFFSILDNEWPVVKKKLEKILGY